MTRQLIETDGFRNRVEYNLKFITILILLYLILQNPVLVILDNMIDIFCQYFG